MSKKIVTSEPPSPKVAAHHHAHASLYASLSAAHAILCGIELLSIQRSLTKLRSDTGDTFKVWLSNFESKLGFGERTAFRYTKLACLAKAKLKDPKVLALLEKSPSSFTPQETKLVLDSVNKSLDGQSLGDLYMEFGIVRRPHGHGLNQGEPRHGNHIENREAKDWEAEASAVVEDHVRSVMVFIDSFSKPVKLGNEQLELWAFAPKEKLRILDQHLEQLIDIRKKIAGALRK